MRKKVILLAGGAFGIAALGVGYFAAPKVASEAAERAVAEWRQSLPEGDSFTYAGMSASAGGSVTFDSPVYVTRQESGQELTIKADRLTASGMEFSGGRVASIGDLSWTNGRLTASGEDGRLRVAEAEFADIQLSPEGEPTYVGHGSIGSVDLEADGSRFQLGAFEFDSPAAGVYDIEMSAFDVANSGANGPDVPFQRLTVGSFDASGIVVGPLDQLGELAEKSGDPASFMGGLNEAADGEMAIRDLSASMGDREIARLGVLEASYGPKGDNGYAVDLRFDDNVATFPEVEGGPRNLVDVFFSEMRELGYGKLTSSGRYSISFDGDRGAFSLDALELDVEDMASVEMNFALSGLQAIDERQAEVPYAKLQDMSAGRLDSFRLRLEDNSLVDRLIERGAERKGMSSDRFRSMSADQLRQMGAMQGLPEIGDKLATFLETSGSLEFVANPDSPVVFEDIARAGMMSPKQAMDKLNLEVRVND